MKDKILAYLMKRMKIEVACGAIIERDGKILLTKRAKTIPEGGKWGLPGGHVDKWERAEKAVIREVKEEIGLETKKSKLLFVHEEFVKRLGLHAVFFVYKLEVSGKEKKNWEVSEIKEFSKKEIEKLDVAFSHREILDKYWRMRE